MKHKLDINVKILYFALVLSLFLGLYFDENSSGGAKHDYNFIKNYIQFFSLNFNFGLESFLASPSAYIHSPVFYILASQLYNVFSDFFYLRIFSIFASCLLPLIFFYILTTVYKNIDKNYLFLFSLLVFLSPYFRSVAIWMNTDNIALIFFSLFILYINKYWSVKQVRFLYYSLLMLSLACYIRYYYAIYYFLILLQITKYHKNNFSELVKFFLLSFCLSFPALFYFFYLFNNLNFLNTVFNFSEFNYINVFIKINNILFFYLLPFIFIDFKNFYKFLKKKNILYLLLIGIIFFNINFFLLDSNDNNINLGGGIVTKSLQFIFNSNYILIVPFVLTLVFVDFFFQFNRSFNYFIFILMILSLPVKIIFQKYLDPLFFIIFFGLVKNGNLNFYFSKLNLLKIFIYFLIFLVFANFYYFKFGI